MEETLTMRNQEIDKLKVIQDVLHGKLTWRKAGQQLGLCVREIGYWCPDSTSLWARSGTRRLESQMGPGSEVDWKVASGLQIAASRSTCAVLL
jgi:hypothetical protein